jgi:hypothetical protein
LKYVDSKGKKAGGDIIKADDPYLRDKLQGSYQQISGSESAAEIENLPKSGEKTKPKPSANNKITVILNGEDYIVDADKWNAIKKKFPNAKRK